MGHLAEVGPKNAGKLSYADFHRVMLSGALSKVVTLNKKLSQATVDFTSTGVPRS